VRRGTWVATTRRMFAYVPPLSVPTRPNILLVVATQVPLRTGKFQHFGLYYLDSRLCLISPWMENGNIMEFMRTDPPNTGRLSLILDVALGLEYLHEQKIVHGDLKGINILVTPSRRACIADFGLSSIVNAMTSRLPTSTAPARGGTARYQAPELCEGDSANTLAPDVDGFACVCYDARQSMRVSANPKIISFGRY